jgi:hypothetical protein
VAYALTPNADPGFRGLGVIIAHFLDKVGDLSAYVAIKRAVTGKNLSTRLKISVASFVSQLAECAHADEIRPVHLAINFEKKS